MKIFSHEITEMEPAANSPPPPPKPLTGAGGEGRVSVRSANGDFDVLINSSPRDVGADVKSEKKLQCLYIFNKSINSLSRRHKIGIY